MIKYLHIMRIGVFDSGIGGKAVADTIRRTLPLAEVITFNDSKNVPYGNKTPDEIIRLTKLAIKPAVESKCDAVVVACNTATTVAISSLRSAYPNENFIGIEPMIKPAALITKTRCIAVCATPSTLKSKRYNDLKKTWAKSIKVIEPDCSDWARLIEQNKSDQIDLHAFAQLIDNKNVDVVVLGCTHFHWLKQRIIDIVGKKVTVLEPSDSIVDRIKSLTEPKDH